MDTEIVTPPAASSLIPPARRRFSVGELLRAFWPVVVVTTGLLILVAHIVREVKASEGGHFVYTIDDTYFHMAVAKNLLQHGLWGTSVLDGFSSGTSSLIWPMIIALSFAVFGVHEYFPLVLNLLAAIGMLFYAGYVVWRTTRSSLLSLLVLAAVVVFMPVLAVAATGMEHCLQALLSVIFVDLAARLLTLDAQRLTSRAAERWLCIVATLLLMTRYEDLFLVAPVGLLLLCQRRWGLAVLLGVSAAAPITIFGLIAVSKGWYFFPNSLLIKGNTEVPRTAAALWDYLTKWYDVMLKEPHMFTLVAAVAVTLIGSLRRQRTLWTYSSLFLFITLLAMLQHLQLAGIGWFYRYEAYLVALGLIGIGIAFGYERSESTERYWLSMRALPHYGALALIGILFGTPIWQRGIFSIHHVVDASYNIYEQQYQMGHFVRQYYDHKGVAANDVGAISFFGQVHMLDVVGLSDIDVLRARRAGTLNPPTIRRLSERSHVELAVIYDSWGYIYGGPLPEWVRVGQWTIPHNMIVGDPTVSFYAPNADLVPKVARQLREFGATLPKDIVQDGLYLGVQPLQVLGTYGPEGAASATVYWTGDTAQFILYPEAGQPLGSDATSLKVMVLPVDGNGQTFEAFFNNQLVGSKTVPAGSPVTWYPIDMKAKWQDGPNVLRLVGHGKAVYPPNDTRPFLFRALDPRRTMDAAGNVVPQTAQQP